MKFVMAILFLGAVGRLFASDSNGSLTFVDEYLRRWDQFAQGQNVLIPYIRDNKKKFEEELSSLLKAGEKRAISRTVFYAVVQVGGFIDVESGLGKEVTRVVGPLPLTEGKKGEKMIFAGDLYFWWEERKDDFPTFSLYEDWKKREFTQNVAIRMYKGARENRKKSG